MGFLDRLFGKKDAAPAAVAEVPVEEECPHGSMSPHWDKPEDFGKNEAIAAYICDSCGKHFSREEGERVMATAGEVVKIDDSVRKTTEEMTEGEKHGEG